MVESEGEAHQSPFLPALCRAEDPGALIHIMTQHKTEHSDD